MPMNNQWNSPKPKGKRNVFRFFFTVAVASRKEICLWCGGLNWDWGCHAAEFLSTQIGDSKHQFHTIVIGLLGNLPPSIDGDALLNLPMITWTSPCRVWSRKRLFRQWKRRQNVKITLIFPIVSVTVGSIAFGFLETSEIHLIWWVESASTTPKQYLTCNTYTLSKPYFFIRTVRSFLPSSS